MWLRLFRPFHHGGARIVFETATLSASGGRAENEDFVGHRMAGDAGCWALADRLGRHRGGEIASRLAVNAVIASFAENPSVTEEALAGHILRANRAVIDVQRANAELVHMRTTPAMFIASLETDLWAHAGDSRLYWLRGGKIEEQTRDDSVPQRLVDVGEITAGQLRLHEDRSKLLNSLGAREQVAASHRAMPAAPEPNDAFLLASDGFWECVTESKVEHDFCCSASSEAGSGKWRRG